MKVRVKSSIIGTFVTVMDGPSMVRRSLIDASADVQGAIEGFEARMDRLVAIVGNLVDLLPEDRRIEACLLQATVERLP